MSRGRKLLGRSIPCFRQSLRSAGHVSGAWRPLRRPLKLNTAGL